MSIHKQLTEVVKRYNDVEWELKQLGLIKRSLRVPAINMLRYAGREIADAWLAYDEKDEAEAVRQLRDANKYCDYAFCEIADAAIVHLERKLTRLNDEYTDAQILRVMPDFVTYKKKLKAAYGVASLSRRERKKRRDEYQGLNDTFVKWLVEKDEVLDDHRETLAAIKVEHEREESDNKIRLYTGVFFGVFTLIGVGIAVYSAIQNNATQKENQELRELLKEHVKQLQQK